MGGHRVSVGQNRAKCGYTGHPNAYRKAGVHGRDACSLSWSSAHPLQTFDKLLQASVIACGVVPEASMSGSQHPNPCAADAIHLLINDSRFDNRISGAMGNQYRFAQLW
jgi:hypothetical protein